MKIYIDATIYSLQKTGGVSRYTTELIRGLAEEGHDVRVILHPYCQSLPPDHTNIHIIRIPPLPLGAKLSKLVDPIYSKLWLWYYFRTNRGTTGIFHSSYLSYYPGVPLPQIVTIYDTTREYFPFSFNHYTNMLVHMMTKSAIKKNDAVICISEQTKRDVQSIFGTKKTKLYVTHLAVGPDFTPQSEEQQSIFSASKNIPTPYLLFVGTRVVYKNFRIIVEACVLLFKTHPGMILLAVGGGAFTKEEDDFIASRGMTDAIRQVDFATEEELKSLYAAAEVFLFPSLSEGFGLPMIEAMACGIPTAVSDIAIFREVGQDVPEYFDPRDKDSIVRAIERALKTTPEQISKGLTLAKRYTWHQTVRKTIDIYNSFIH